jgi:hypothetical protein
MIVDLVNEALSVQGLIPQTLAASAQGSSQDFTNGEISTNAIVTVGAFTANTTNLQVQIEESATGTNSWTAISGMVATITASNTQTVLRGLRTHRYVRANAISVQGTTPSTAVAVVILAQKKIFGGSDNGGYSRSPST